MPELASLLRAWRDRISPVEAGLPSGGDRRSPGLRREELAMLANLSVDYVVRLEQGRATHPSPQVLGSLARALRLTNDERDHLFRIGRVAVPTKTMVPRHVTPGVRHIVDRLSEVPVAVFSAAWDALLVNDLWLTLFGEAPAAGRGSNLLWNRFAGGPSFVEHSPEHLVEFHRDLVADVHVASTRYPDDTALSELIADLRATSEEFERLWSSATFGEHRESRKTVQNALVGPITFDCDVLAAPGSDLKIVVYTVVPGSTDAARLDLLRVSAIRTFA
ncbi:helix-turn-helix transcriptional regulator [Cryobacterium glucosi]|uniref:XRE family transcriptional regulator n=2 Tax=Bacteria TaxID=2 RepID=A0ABY2III6_9MICO|nr:helix-turn-helix transcriptional regulator [Cryobacterium glucosi]TFC17282.1 XRE family transcriptional regulator [Cryobacterium glucosi]